jgi:hypothetical protein
MSDPTNFAAAESPAGVALVPADPVAPVRVGRALPGLIPGIVDLLREAAQLTLETAEDAVAATRRYLRAG